MRSLILAVGLLAGATTLAAGDYSEVREFKMSVGGIETLVIKAGQGDLDIRGVAGGDAILVTATIVVPDADEGDGRTIIEKELRLDLGSEAGTARLESWFTQRFWGFGSNGRIDLEVTAPSSLELRVDDGAGDIRIHGFTADIDISDGSGSLEVRDIGSVGIDDGSGSIDVADARGDVTIDDGSGSILVERVLGNVTIDDGSGGIEVNDVEGDLVIVDAGSGGVRFSGVKGVVEQET